MIDRDLRLDAVILKYSLLVEICFLVIKLQPKNLVISVKTSK